MICESQNNPLHYLMSPMWNWWNVLFKLSLTFIDQLPKLDYWTISWWRSLTRRNQFIDLQNLIMKTDHDFSRTIESWFSYQFLWKTYKHIDVKCLCLLVVLIPVLFSGTLCAKSPVVATLWFFPSERSIKVPERCLD